MKEDFDLEYVISILDGIAGTDEDIKEKISELQDYIWHGPSIHDERLHDILVELAHDIDYFESNPAWRAESSSFYGKDKLDKLVLAARKEICRDE